MTASLPISRGAHFDDGQTVFGLLAPGFVSLLALCMAVVASGVSQGVLNVFIGLQAVLLALAASMSTSSAAFWTARWQGRMAPSRGPVQARQRLWRQLAVSAGLGVCGPLALGFHAEVVASWSLTRMPQALLVVLALLMAAQALGAWCGLSAGGKAGRWVLLGWVVLVLALMRLRSLRELLLAWPGLSLLALLLLALGWWVLRQRLAQPGQCWAGLPTVVGAQPTPRPAQLWQPLPFDGDDAQGGDWRFDHLPAWRKAGMFLLWTVAATALRYQAWEGQVQGIGVAAYAGWMAWVTGVAGYALVHPAAHWRRRLAPGGMTPLQWARRMWLRSLAYGVLWLTLLVGSAAFGASSQARLAMLGTWPTALGDVCLAYALAAWMRAWRNDHKGLLLAVALMFGVMFTLTAAAAGIGHPLVRGGGWLAVELSLAAVLGVAAVRRWARRNGPALA